METTQEELATYLSSLSPVLQHILTAEETSMVITDTANHFGLDTEKRDLLSDEVLLTLMGIDSTQNFKNNLMVNLGLTDTVATGIEGIITEKIFNPVQEELSLLSKEQAERTKEEGGMEIISQSTPEATSIPASAVPTHKPMGFGMPQKNMDILSVQEEGAISYQPGVSLKDTLLREDSSKTNTTNPSESAFAKKLSSLDEGGGK